MSTRVFVGNLSFRITDQDLEQEFKKYGEVTRAVIITRGRRSLGYGFVEFSDAAAAEASLAHDQGDLAGRPVKVELAKTVEEREAQYREGLAARANQDDQTQTQTQTQTRQNRPNRQNRAQNEGQNQGQDQNQVQGQKKPNQRNQGQRRRQRQNKGQNKGQNQDQDQNQDQNQNQNRNQNQNQNQNQNDQNENADQQQDKKKKRTRRRARKQNPDAEPKRTFSEFTLFVANLPFSVTDEDLGKIFEGTGFNSVHIVHTRNGRSRGYGFVEFSNQEDQVKALEAKNGFEIQDASGKPARNISISLSTTNNTSQNEEQPAEEKQ